MGTRFCSKVGDQIHSAPAGSMVGRDAALEVATEVSFPSSWLPPKETGRWAHTMASDRKIKATSDHDAKNVREEKRDHGQEGSGVIVAEPYRIQRKRSPSGSVGPEDPDIPVAGGNDSNPGHLRQQRFLQFMPVGT
ncbi:MAG: hypothetical protein JW829_20945 [Pirellulales bacterium]|nr:hypothetical protein [Pirellulales bacterium]